MTVTINDIRPVSPFQSIVEWSSDLGSDIEVTVWQWGAKITTTKDTEWPVSIHQFAVDKNIQVLDSDDVLEDVGVSSRVSPISWYESEDENQFEVEYYEIDQWNGASWDNLNRIQVDGSASYTWETPYLENLTEAKFRIVAVGLNGNSGASREITFTPVGYDDAPTIGYAYSSVSTKVTVTAS